MSTWQVAPRDEASASALARRLGVTPVTGHLLARRGLAEPELARGFLRPLLGQLHDPAGLPGMQAATARVVRAIEQGEAIHVHGDYDVDGTTGAVVLSRLLGKLGGQVSVHVPDRSEGYGLSLLRVEAAAREGTRLLITVDNGIAALDEAARLRALGIDLVVCDHHGFSPRGLPEAAALIHPRLEGSTYPNPHLCGAGVAFKLAWSVASHLGGGKPSRALQDELLAALAFVALGTVADVVPLVGENRVLVRYGLKALGARPTEGVKALLEAGRIEGAPEASDVAFRLAPRLNAAGRMGRARRAFELLQCDDAAEARRLAEELDQENDRRRTLQERVTREAVEQVRAAYPASDGFGLLAPGVVAWPGPGQEWPHGVVGIVAAKLVETFRRPVLVASLEGELARGSGRSCQGVDLLRSLGPATRAEPEPLLSRSGGHQAAVGFTCPAARLPELRAAFSRGVLEALELPAEPEPREVAARLQGYEVVADAEVSLDEVSRQLVDELEQLSPFGEGNREPLFAARAVTLAGEPRLMGKTGRHVSCWLRQGERVLRAVAFDRPELWEALRERARPGPQGSPPLEVAFRPRLNRWNGDVSIELELAAVRFPS